MADYKILNNQNGGVKWKSLLTAGIVNNSIEEDVQAMVKNSKAVPPMPCYLTAVKMVLPSRSPNNTNFLTGKGVARAAPFLFNCTKVFRTVGL